METRWSGSRKWLSCLFCKVIVAAAVIMLLYNIYYISNTKAGSASSAKQIIDPATFVKLPKGFIVFLTGNWAGHLEPCGCSEAQLGGIDRRTGILKLATPKRRLLIDVGPLVVDQELQSKFKLEAFLQSLYQLDYDAISLTPQEIRMLKEDVGLAHEQIPTVITSNLPEQTREEYQTVTHYKKTLVHNNKTLDCLVLSVCDPHQIAKANLIDSDQGVPDPYERVEALLTSLDIDPDDPCDPTLVILTLSADNDDIADPLAEIPAIDILVKKGAADEPEYLNKPQKDSKKRPRPMIVTTGFMGKYVTCIAVAPEADAYSLSFSLLQVEDRYIKDPEIVSILDSYQLQLQMENIIADDTKLIRQPLPDNNRFVGSAICKGCHKDVYEKWQSFKHAHALDTLIKVKRNYDPECVACHTVGMRYETGFRSKETTADLANVGCEMCHGPALNHLIAADKKNPPYKGTFTTCVTCHDHERSPSFDKKRQQYMDKIKHWKQPKKSQDIK